MKCPHCGGETGEGKKFCTHCGKSLNEAPVTKKQPKPPVDKQAKKKTERIPFGFFFRNGIISVYKSATEKIGGT